jgi:anaerobic magnesium-protoporphyrin IX monomethyl ester cyclase
LESGSDLVLEMMGKGKQRVSEVLRPAFEAFRQTRVGLQPLFFFGFPRETDADRQKTVELLKANKDIFCTITKAGIFALLPGSYVAKQPAAHGIKRVYRREGEDIGWDLEYENISGDPPPNAYSFGAFNRQLPHSEMFERPWAGGIDTLHSQLYVERYGRDIFHRLREQGAGDGARQKRRLRWRSAYDLHVIGENTLIHEALRAQNAHGSDLGNKVSTRFVNELHEVLSPVAKANVAGEFVIEFSLDLTTIN